MARGGRVYVAEGGGPAVAVYVILSGSTPVPLPPRYQLPISVKLPLEFNMAEFMPMLDTDDRKDPKYE